MTSIRPSGPEACSRSGWVDERTIGRRDALRITAAVGISGVLGGGLLAELIRQSRVHRVRESRTRMGTIVTLTVIHPSADAARGTIDRAFDEMARLEGILSRHRPDTPLARLNRLGRLSRPPTELVHLLARADEYAARSHGAFDITVAPVLDLYRRSFEDRNRAPDAGALAAARALVGHEGIVRTEGEVRFARSGMSITLDGIAKGYIVDRTVDTLERAGADRVLVDAGGDMSTSAGSGPDGAVGGREGEPWTIGVQDPHGRGGLLGLVRLAGTSIATSGDYLHPFTPDRRHHHIIDPRTGRSPGEVSAVSIVAGSALEADALSTAAMVMGPTEAVRMLDALEQVEGLIVDKHGTRLETSGFGRHTVS